MADKRPTVERIAELALQHLANSKLANPVRRRRAGVAAMLAICSILCSACLVGLVWNGTRAADLSFDRAVRMLRDGDRATRERAAIELLRRQTIEAIGLISARANGMDTMLSAHARNALRDIEAAVHQ